MKISFITSGQGLNNRLKNLVVLVLNVNVSKANYKQFLQRVQTVRRNHDDNYNKQLLVLKLETNVHCDKRLSEHLQSKSVLSVS